MNNRPTTYSNNEWIRQKTNHPCNQNSQDIVSPHNMRPPYRLHEKFNNEFIAENNKPEAARFNSQYHERTANLTYSAPVNFKSGQDAINSTRLNHQTSSSDQINSNFQYSQALPGIRHNPQRMNFNAPNSDRFSKIPCNVDSAQSSERNYSSNFSDQYIPKNPPFNQFQLTNLNNNFTRQPPPPVSNMPNVMTQTFQSNSHTSNFIRPPEYSNLNSRQPTPQESRNPNFARQPTLPDSGNHNFVRQLAPSSFGNHNFVRQSTPSDSGNQNFLRQPTMSGSGNPDLVRQPSPLDFNKPDCIRQPHLPSPVMQPPPVLPPTNVYTSSGNFSGPMQTPPQIPAFVVPTLNQSSNYNITLPNISVPPPPVNQDLLEENKINKFLQRFSLNEKSSTKCVLTMSEFRSKLKEAFSAAKKLMALKSDLLNLLDANENDWNEKLKEISHYKDKLSRECDLLSEPKVLNLIQERLESRKRKRELKKKIRANKREEKAKKLKIREELHQTTDKWLESIKEKNLKLKREAEMKKEADFILAEVRRKIHEAKRTIEKLKVFEKLRSARHANAAKKGLFLPEHDEKFKLKISELKATLFKQLSDYESEEKALKVMLEAEQEGQLEEEALWRIKKLKTAQQRRQKNISEALFGTEEEPTEDDPIFLFHQFQNSGNKSIESLVQIRHQWDLHLNAEGETIPSQWVVPVPPNSAAWEATLSS